MRYAPFGANYVIRRPEQLDHLYDPRLGVNHGKRLQGEEVVVIRKLLKTGSGWWVPDARVLHLIGPERQTFRYLRERYLGAGASLVRSQSSSGKRFSLRSLVPLGYQAVKRTLHYVLVRSTRSPRDWLPLFCSAARAWGAFLETLGLLRSSPMPGP